MRAILAPEFGYGWRDMSGSIDVTDDIPIRDIAKSVVSNNEIVTAIVDRESSRFSGMYCLMSLRRIDGNGGSYNVRMFASEGDRSSFLKGAGAQPSITGFARLSPDLNL